MTGGKVTKTGGVTQIVGRGWDERNALVLDSDNTCEKCGKKKSEENCGQLVDNRKQLFVRPDEEGACWLVSVSLPLMMMMMRSNGESRWRRGGVTYPHHSTT